MSDLMLRRPSRSRSEKFSVRLEAAIIGAAVIAGLYFGRDVLIPIAVAVIISFALSPLARVIERLRVGRVPSVALSVIFALALVGGVGAIIGNQLSDLAEELPSYQTNITAKIRAVREGAGDLRLFNRASKVLRQISDEIAQPNGPVPPAPATSPSNRATTLQAPPAPVEIRPGPATPFQVLKEVLQPLLQPLATAGIIVVFVVFFLLQREDIRSRFIRLLGTRDIQRTTVALNDAGGRLSRYLLTQVWINGFFGILVGAGLAVIGVPNPVLWGIFAMVLRFVPYIGAILAAIAPAVVALGVDPDWSMFWWTMALFAVIEPLIAYGLEPVLYGHTTGLSPVAVVVAMTFWTSLWGPIGLLLSTPLTLCLVVIGRHVERLEFFDVVLGDQPPLTPAESFYHHMLAGNAVAVGAQAQEYLKNGTIAEYHDEVTVKALTLAQADIARGRMDPDSREEMFDFLLEFVNDFRSDATPDDAAPQVLCIAGRTPFDEVVSRLFVHMLVERGVASRVAETRRLTANAVDSLDFTGIGVVCISYTGGEGYGYARTLVRRIRRRAPGVKIMLGLWGMDAALAVHSGIHAEVGSDSVATTLKHAAEMIAGRRVLSPSDTEA